MNNKQTATTIIIILLVIIAGALVYMAVKKPSEVGTQIPAPQEEVVSEQDQQTPVNPPVQNSESQPTKTSGAFATYTGNGFSLKYNTNLATPKYEQGYTYFIDSEAQEGGDMVWIVSGPIPSNLGCSAVNSQTTTVNGKTFHYCDFPNGMPDSMPEAARLYYYSKNGKTLVMTVTTVKSQSGFLDLATVEIN